MPTRVPSEQLTFRSANSGNQVLDTYLENAEIGGQTLATLLGKIFNSSDGSIDVFTFTYDNTAGAEKINLQIGTNGTPTEIASFSQFFTDINGVKTATQNLLDQFDDTYLGAKSADPTADNDGDALTTGDIYFNTTDNVLKFYSGSAWVAPESIASASATAAQTSATNAATSETNAATSATNAATSETNAATSETNAGTSATSASASQTAAANSATSASTSASNASSSASTATTKAGEASTSATNAATSETNAATSATNAATSATNAATSETNAATSATNASNSATAASTSEGNASTSASAAASSATAAATSATNASNSATAASNSASSASTSATNAATSETNAATSASNASTSATSAAANYDSFDDRFLGAKSSDPTTDNDGDALLTGALYWNTTTNGLNVYSGSSWVDVSDQVSSAATSATNAATSATSAATSASSAQTSATNAGQSAISAVNSATAAASSASAASTSETNAGTSETNASTSATNAATSANAASSSATAAAASYDAFDDRYLGSKSSDPSTDNDGDALLTGALYYNTTTDDLRVYNGSAWQVAAASASSFLTTTGGTLTGDLNGTNVTLSGYLRGPSSFTIDPAAHGNNTGTVVIAGNLQVDGSSTTINSTTVAVDDLNLTVASGAANAAAANGAGLTVDGANATFTYASSGDKWQLNKPLDVSGNIIVSGTVDGRDIATDGTKLDGIEANAKDDQTISTGGGLSGGGTGNVTISHADTSSQASSNNSGRTYIQDITLDTYGHVTGLSTATETVVNTDTNTTSLPIENSSGTTQFTATDSTGLQFASSGGASIAFDSTNRRVTIGATNTNTNQLTTFQVEDGDGTEVTISQGKEWKFVEGGGIDINWTDTSTGSDADPYDLTFTHADTSSQGSVNNSGNTVIQDVTLDGYGHVTGLTSKALSIPNAANNATVTVSAGNALTGGGTFNVDQASNSTITINHEDTSSQASVNGSGRTYIQDITLDAYGHVTGIGTATETVVNTDTNTTSLAIENVSGTSQFTVTDTVGLEFAAGGAASVAFDSTNKRVTYSSTNTEYSNATTSTAGLMSSSDKTKLDGIETGADVTDAANVSNAGAAMLTGADFTGVVTFNSDTDLNGITAGNQAIYRGSGALKLTGGGPQNSRNLINLSNNAGATIYGGSASTNATLRSTYGVTIDGGDGDVTLDSDVTFTGASYNAVWDKSDNALEFADNAKAIFGGDTDGAIYSDGNNFIIDGTTTGIYQTLIQGTKGVKLRNNGGSGGYADGLIVDGADAASTRVRAQYGTTTRLETTSSGVTVTGTIFGDALDIDNIAINGGTITAQAGSMTLSGNVDVSNGLDVTGNITVSGTVDGVDVATRDGVLTSTTTTANAAMPKSGGTFTGDVTFNEDLLVGQNDKLWLGYVSGNSNMGLELYNSGTSATIENHNFVTTYKSDGHTFKRHSTDREYMTLNEDTNNTVSLKAGGSTKLQTSGTGVTVTGTLAATAVTGDGSGLTNVSATDSTKMPLSGGTFTGDVTFDGSAANIVFDESHDALVFYQAADLKFADSAGTSKARIFSDGTRVTWQNSSSEPLRIDANANGFEIKSVSNNMASFETTGIELYHNNSKKFETTSSGVTVNGASSDGDIAVFQKDGTTVGSVGTGTSGSLFIGNGDTGLLFSGTGDRVLPYDPSGPSTRDAAVDLGSTTARFADIFLSGNIYCGGQIGGDSNDYITFTNNTQMDVFINGSNEFRFESDGDFHADGNVVAYSTTVASDAALKENIQPVTGLASVMALDGVSFDWKRDGKKSAGVIAQQVQKIMPEAVQEVKAMDGSKHLSVNYNALTSVLVEAIKDLKSEIEVLKNALNK